MTDKQCLIVLGMHRSGTSCLTGTIEQYGVHLGEVFTENRHNEKGNRESAGVQALNNDLLAANGGKWDQPLEVTSWSKDHEKRRDSIINKIRAKADMWWGFKDPRVMFTLPFWLEALGEVHFIGTFRHPHAVALSLEARSGMTLEDAYSLWLSYNEKLLSLLSRYDVPLIDFDLPDDIYEREVSVQMHKFGLKRAADTDAFFTPGLRHQSAESTAPDLPDQVATVYRALQAQHAEQRTTRHSTKPGSLET